jgi:hypothetical protein
LFFEQFLIYKNYFALNTQYSLFLHIAAFDLTMTMFNVSIYIRYFQMIKSIITKLILPHHFFDIHKNVIYFKISYWNYEGDSAYAVPTTKNYASELSTLGIIAGVNPTAVQWRSLALGEPP